MFVGIDVAKAELVVSMRPSAERFTVANDERGVRTLVERLRSVTPTLIVLEASGGYELLSVAALAAAGQPVVVVNPRQVRDFAKATGQLARSSYPSSRLLKAHRGMTLSRRAALAIVRPSVNSDWPPTATARPS
jgi:transposase